MLRSFRVAFTHVRDVAESLTTAGVVVVLGEEGERLFKPGISLRSRTRDGGQAEL